MEGTDYLLTNVAFYWARKRFWPRKNKLSQEKNCLAFVNGLRPIFSNHWCKLDHMLLNLLVHLVNGLIFLLGHTYSAQIILYTLKSKRRRSRLSVCATVEGKFRRQKSFCSVTKVDSFNADVWWAQGVWDPQAWMFCKDNGLTQVEEKRGGMSSLLLELWVNYKHTQFSFVSDV